MSDVSSRPTPEQMLAKAQREESLRARGRLKVFLGYASGVGKSFQLFDEGRRRKERGEDVVVCAVQREYTPEVGALLEHLESVPMLRVGVQDVVDVAAVLRRRPEVALIDGLAFDNPAESPNQHRWQDVEQLLQAGISVVTSVNVQYLEKCREEAEKISGKHVPYIIPGGFLDQHADEIALVDAPAADCLPPAGAPPVRHSEEIRKLSRLRELALLVAAGVVDHQLEHYAQAYSGEHTPPVQERILVCITPRSDAAAMLDSGRRVADRFHGELFVAYVRQPALSQLDRATLRQNLGYARRLGADVTVLRGLDSVDALLSFARVRGITQIFIGRSKRSGAWRRLWRNSIERLIRAAEGIDVVVYPHG